jgi:hypothetical protein
MYVSYGTLCWGTQFCTRPTAQERGMSIPHNVRRAGKRWRGSLTDRLGNGVSLRLMSEEIRASGHIVLEGTDPRPHVWLRAPALSVRSRV